MAQTPIDPMKAKLQRNRSRVQKTPQQFSKFCFTEADDKFRPFLKASKLPLDSPVENNDAAPVFGNSVLWTDKRAWAHIARVI